MSGPIVIPNGSTPSGDDLSEVARQTVIPMTHAQMLGWSGAPAGAVVWDTTYQVVQVYDGTNWANIGGRRLGVHLAEAGGVQTVPTATDTDCQFGLATDPDGYYTGPEITVPVGLGGVYALTLMVNAGSAFGAGAFLKLAKSTGTIYTEPVKADATVKVLDVISRLGAGETVTPRVLQGSGGDIQITSRLDCYRFSP